VGSMADLDRCGKVRPTGIRSPDRPDSSESLYRLSYTCPVLLPPVTTFYNAIFYLVKSKLKFASFVCNSITSIDATIRNL